MSDNVAIGIDLGTTYCCVAVVQNGITHTCRSNEGQRITPSYVCYTENERLVGYVAKLQSVQNHFSTIYDAKRLIGKQFKDVISKYDLYLWPFKIINDDGKLKIQIEVANRDNNEKKSFFPEEISKALLEKMKLYAESFLNHPVDKAVVTVPAYFTDAQRTATQWAANAAGLKVLRLLNEPTAAAFEYGIKMKGPDGRHLLVFDLGGGTFDVTILKIFKTTVNVVSVMGDNSLGGRDFDNNLTKHCLNVFKKKTTIDLESIKNNNSIRAIRRLQLACENAKIVLSTAHETVVVVDYFYNNLDFNHSISRALFESLNAEQFQKCIKLVNICLEEAEKKNVTKDNLEIILVGGSTRIPKIKKMLSEKFPSISINRSLNPDEAVAHGAAILADILNKAKCKGMQDDSLRDITPLSLGVESFGGIMSVILPKNTEIPNKITKVYSTVEDNQESILISIYEGERAMVEDNNLLNEFEITGIPRGKKGTVKIDVTFDIDSNNILKVSGVEKSKSINKTILVNRNQNFSEEDFKRILEDEKNYKLRDNEKREAIIAKNKLITYVENMKTEIKSKVVKDKLTSDQLCSLQQLYDDAINYCNFSDSNKNIWDEKRQKLIDEYTIMMK